MRTAPQETLRTTLLPAALPYQVALVLAGTVLLALSAKIQVPFFPVPMTLQTFAVLFLGFALGAKYAGITLLAYLAEGAAGLPVFAGTPEKGVGLAYMMGPTGGYLLGFVMAAVATGYLAERGWDKLWWKAAIAALIGMVLIYVPGLLWLGTIVGWDQPVLAWGLWPFLYGEALKLGLLAFSLPILWHRIRRKGLDAS
ncbi:MAG: biotin transporter BioY [Pseudomonadota bacterium]